MSAAGSAGTGDRRLVTADQVGRSGLTLAFEAGETEREALARRLDLLSLEALTAELRFAPADQPDGAICVSGTIDARLVQRCVVTLEPVPCSVSEPVSALYAPAPAEQAEHEVEVLPEGEEAEPLPADGIDAGAVVVEHLALILDPYPRHPDAPAGPLTYAEGEGDAEEGTHDSDSDAGPFAALGQLKSKL
ncbi:MAG: DUF177 domain-containing protein [Rhodospirillales bacterium]|nr:DUF177 domain-containing protein [Rhodospirillales bacterium]